MTSIRTFCAVEIPPDLRESIHTGLQPLQSLYPQGRWVAPGNLHLTVKFLGQVARQMLPEVGRVVAEAVRDHQPFAVRLAGAGVFGAPGNARVIWLGVAGGGRELSQVAAAVDQGLVSLGLEQERRPFRAHLTVARCPGGVLPPTVRDGLAELSNKEWGQFSVCELATMRSDLRPAGPVYRPLFRCPLGGPSSVV